MHVSSSRLKRSRSIVHMYALTDCTSSEPNNDFHQESSPLVCSVCSTGIVFLTGDFNAQLEYLTKTKRYIGGQFLASPDRTDYGDRLIQVCFDHKLCLPNTNFYHKMRYRITCRGYSPSECWTQVDHTAIGHR